MRAGERRVEFGGGVVVVSIEDVRGNHENAEIEVTGLPESTITDQRSKGMAIGKLSTNFLPGIDIIGRPVEMRQRGSDCRSQRQG